MKNDQKQKNRSSNGIKRDKNDQNWVRIYQIKENWYENHYQKLNQKDLIFCKFASKTEHDYRYVQLNLFRVNSKQPYLQECKTKTCFLETLYFT